MGGNRINGNNYTSLGWCATIGGMVHYGARVRAECRKCKVCLEVDLIPLLAKLGPQATLLDRHPPCRVVGCDGEILFVASPGEGTPFMPCVVRKDVL